MVKLPQILQKLYGTPELFCTKSNSFAQVDLNFIYIAMSLGGSAFLSENNVGEYREMLSDIRNN